MKRKRKNDIYVEGSRVEQVREGENEKQWRDEKVRGKRKSWRSVNIKNINVKNNYKKIGKKKVNDVDVDVAQLEHSNNKCCASVYIYIYIYAKNEIVTIQIRYSKSNRQTLHLKINC